MNTINENDTYIINPYYNIRGDVYRAVITNSKGIDTFVERDDVNKSFVQILNPVSALLFTYFDGTSSFGDTIKALAEDFKNEVDNLKNYVVQFIENPQEMLVMLEDNPPFILPKRFIIKKEEADPVRDFDTDSLIIDKDTWDLERTRLYIPNNMTLMITNRCVTDCIYCYADKCHKLDRKLTIDRIKEIMQEASDIGVTDFALNGGDLFAYRYWKDVLLKSVKLGFTTHVSTKYPLNYDDIKFLKDIGVNSIQISYDSDDSDVQQKLLKVGSDYREKMLNTFSLLEEFGMIVNIKSVITRYNSQVSDIKKLLDRLTSFKNIEVISLAPAESSLYKNFEDYRPEREDLDRMKKYVEEIKDNYKDVIIYCQDYATEEDFCKSFEEKHDLYQERTQCTGNVMGLYILPDGKVGICEELYWHPNFILGDLNEQSIMEVWNSEKAKNLYNIQQGTFPESSVCAGCKSFDVCRKRRGVCWKMIFQAYGMENIYNPDPRCPFAQHPEKVFYQKSKE